MIARTARTVESAKKLNSVELPWIVAVVLPESAEIEDPEPSVDLAGQAEFVGSVVLVFVAQAVPAVTVPAAQPAGLVARFELAAPVVSALAVPAGTARLVALEVLV